MMSAIAFCIFNVGLAGKVEDKRSKLKQLLADGDEEHNDTNGSEADVEPQCDKSCSDDDRVGDNIIVLSDLNLGDIVEVYWHGDKEWYEGEVTGCDEESCLVEVHYKSDNKKLWHTDDYKFRRLD